jgi:hypothetical protein
VSGSRWQHVSIFLRNQGDQMSLGTTRPKCSPTHFCQNECATCTVENIAQKFVLRTSVIFKNMSIVNNRQKMSHMADLLRLIMGQLFRKTLATKN